MYLLRKLVPLFVFFTTISLFAQKGDIMIGLQASYQQLTSEFSENNKGGNNFSLFAEYMASDKVSLCFALEYNTFNFYLVEGTDLMNKESIDFAEQNHCGSLQVGGKYYFLNMKKNISPYIGINLGYYLFHEKLEVSNYDYIERNLRLMGFKPNAGVAFPLSKALNAYIDLSYTITYINSGSDDWTGYYIISETFRNYDFWRIGAGFSVTF